MKINLSKFIGVWMTIKNVLKNHKKFYVVAAIGLMPVLLLFQNCGKGFQAQSGVELSSVADLPSRMSFPQINIAPMDSLTNQSSVTLKFTVTGVSSNEIKSLTCQLGTNQPQDCSSLSVIFSNLVDGDYSAKVMVETISGIKNEALQIFRKDGTAPVILVSSAPSVSTNQTTASFLFSTNDNLSGVEKIECIIDTTVFNTCNSPFNLTALSAGNHMVKIRATDKAKNTSLEYSYTWNINFTVPTVLFTVTPSALTNLSTASFTFSGVGILSYECQLDSGSYSVCTSPNSLPILTSGYHTFRVRGTNGITTSSPVSYTWIVDNVAPIAPNLTANIPKVTNNQNSQFIFNSSDSLSGIDAFQCSIDGESFATCTSPTNFVNSIKGNHSFSVRAIDKVGNISSNTVFSWIIDLTPPTLAFTLTPSKIQLINAVSNFKFTANDPQGVTSITCNWSTPTLTNLSSDCSTGSASYNLPQGSYLFTVQARDSVGNISSLYFVWNIGEVIQPNFLKAKAISVKSSTNCVITELGGVKCWGMNNVGQLGNNSPEDSRAPVDIVGLSNITAISTGGFHTCAITNQGNVKCWVVMLVDPLETIRLSIQEHQ